MRIAVRPALLEEAVFHATRLASSRGDDLPERALRRSLDAAYLLPAGPDRDRRFRRANAVAFARLGLAATLRGILSRHPGLARADGPVSVGPAPGRALEGVDLHERPGEGGRPQRTVVVRVLPATLADPGAAAIRLHRDAAKTADLLDPAFAWTWDAPEPTPARRESVRLRYGAAWNAWTDGRLERRGLPAPVPRERAESEFAAAFAGALGAGGAAAAFERLRATGALTHADLLRLARDPAGPSGAASPAGPAPRPAATPVPGSPCPLCRFPTHDWVDDAERLPESVLRAARESLPGWTPGEGICGQCALLFRSRAPAR